MKASMFYRIAAVLLLLFTVGTYTRFRQSDPKWGVDASLAQCGQFTLTCRGSTARIGTSFWRPDSLSACLCIPRRYWHRQLGGLPAATLALMRGTAWRSPFALGPSRLLSWRYLLSCPSLSQS